MYRLHTNKVAVDGIDRYLARLRREVRRSALHLLLFRVACFVGIPCLFALLALPLGFIAIVVTILAALCAWAVDRRRRAIHDLRQARQIFLDALLQRLRDDLAPTEKVRVRYHELPVDDSLHQVRSKKSSAGRIKTYHRSQWLRVRGVLADGTRFRIKLQRAAKQKRGQTLRQHSALVLEVTPPAGCYPAATGAAGDTGEALRWGEGRVTRKPEQGTLVFRFLIGESEMLEQIYRALRYTVSLYPAPPGPAPSAAAPA